MGIAMRFNEWLGFDVIVITVFSIAILLPSIALIILMMNNMFEKKKAKGSFYKKKILYLCNIKNCVKYGGCSF